MPVRYDYCGDYVRVYGFQTVLEGVILQLIFLFVRREADDLR